MIPSPTNIAKIHSLFRSGELTPRELVDQCFNRIDSREADVHAWVMLDREGALRQADEQLRLALGQAGAHGKIGLGQEQSRPEIGAFGGFVGHGSSF